MPICARCLGVGIGHVLALGARIMQMKVHLVAIACFALILYADWALQEWCGIMSTNPRRLVTGFLGGFGLGFLWWTVLFSVVAWTRLRLL